MSESTLTYLKVLSAAWAALFCVFMPAGSAMAGYPVVKSIHVKDNPFSVTVNMTGKAPVKVIRIGKREVLVAIKNATLSKGLVIAGKDNPNLESVHVETLEGNVVALMLTSKYAGKEKIKSSFDTANNRLTVVLNKAVAPRHKAPPVPQAATIQKPLTQGVSKPEKQASTPATEYSVKKKDTRPAKADERIKEPPLYIPPERQASRFKGDISDMYRGEDPLQGCQTKAVENAMLLVKKQLYKEAGAILEQYLFEENPLCMEQVYYLKAYVNFMDVDNDDHKGLLNAERMFQDAMVAYPKSSYLPFAYAAMGLIHTRLHNNATAEGYFDIISKDFPDYSGMPEVEYHLAEIYNDKGYIDKALNLYKKVFESKISNGYISDAGIGYGKALFENLRYYDALSVFNYVIKNDVKKVYQSADLLKYTADANFELGLSKGARENYIRLLNLFPDIKAPDMALSKAGDAYGMENQEEKAIKLYELVRKTYPDSPGYINASIGLARYLKTDAEKIDIYEMIKTQFPENTYARIAMMRLAEIYQKNGEYDKCIQEIEDLLSTHPKGLRYEAVKLMQKAYEALFKEQLKADGYTSVLMRYEKERLKIKKMGGQLIPFYVGSAYLQANLYEEAFNQLISAYKLYKREERPALLLFGLGKAMDESGRDEDALKLLNTFAKRFPTHKNRVEALTRVGQIYVEKGNASKADDAFVSAYQAEENTLDKGRILMLRAGVYQKKSDLKTASELQARAVKAFAASPGENYEILAGAYKTLGSTYLEMKAYGQAANAFAKAFDFSEGDQAKANIGFLLGDAYQKGNVLDKAKKTFEQVAQSYDSVWARLARQRLSTIELVEKMINS
ncbi:MAG: tetratricopeptide repeat protein [Desulfobacter postgatei]|uniref:tetratricopeptide repeat protein n=1 Tax=Desulfobacter postgatei TaxID=2293 RepID=UPI0023F3FD5E|nr:tetratricopeptide repeat protein [Desulfobacter postgatei]MDD4274052.1 tetratricopeptide repeat protein [Desulfobacter postgatei]